jgi:hypothetical protein
MQLILLHRLQISAYSSVRPPQTRMFGLMHVMIY